MKYHDFFADDLWISMEGKNFGVSLLGSLKSSSTFEGDVFFYLDIHLHIFL